MVDLTKLKIQPSLLNEGQILVTSRELGCDFSFINNQWRMVTDEYFGDNGSLEELIQDLNEILSYLKKLDTKKILKDFEKKEKQKKLQKTQNRIQQLEKELAELKNDNKS